MPKNKIYAHVVLDRSGSMQSCLESTIDAFNEYVASLKSGDVSARVSLTIFDSEGVDLIHDNLKAGDVPKLTKEVFVPRAMTPLNDAIGKTAAHIAGQRRRKDENVALVILTDGLENASTEYTKESVRKLLDAKQKEGWLVIYLGANQDAWAEGAARGTAFGNTMTYDTNNMKQAMAAVTRSTMAYAATGSASLAAFTDEERKNSA